MTEQIRVLVVDDTPDIRMLLTAALGALGGFDVIGEAEDGAEAIKLAAALKPDAILLDLAMPVMDGLQAAPEIRTCAPDARIIILSGFSKDRLADEARAAGADAYVEKGTSPVRIAQVIRAVCESPRAPYDPAPESSEDAEEEPSGGFDSWRKRIAMAVEHVGELSGAFSSFGQTVRSRVSFDHATFALSEPGGYRFAAVCGAESGSVAVGTLIPISGSLVTDLDKGTTVTVDEVDRDADEWLDAYLLNPRVRSYAAVPVRAAGRAQAIVSFASEQPGAFTQEDIDYLESAVREASAALHLLWCLGRQQDAGLDIDEAEKMRREWNRVVRHDLRSPLTVISGFAETMRTAWSDLPDDKKLSFVDAIARGADAMTTLLADMEDVDRLESGIGAGEARPICLGALVSMVATDLSTSSGRRVVTKISEGLPAGLADELDQKRVLSNLIENAFKFSDSAEPVEVAVAASGGMIHVAVTDRGAGIAVEEQSKVFDKFSRATQGQKGPKVPGSGLGLYICRSIVEAHGGRIWVDSVPGEGATFHYTIPAALAA